MSQSNQREPAAPAVAFPVDRRVRPLVWARKDQLQHAITRGGLMCAMYPHAHRRADLQPLYDEAALDAAVAAERERCADKVRAHLGRTVMSVYGTSAECKAARDALQRLLDDGA